MKKYSMLAGAIGIMAVNLYGIIISTMFSPVTPAMLTTSILVILIVTYIELNKRRVLVNNHPK
jgi:CHASE2 domain-containing sensor protein